MLESFKVSYFIGLKRNESVDSLYELIIDEVY
jgi:hypothetical protein